VLVPLLCTWLALAPSGKSLYVARREPPRIVTFNTEQGKPGAAIRLPSPPTGLAAAGSRLYVTSNAAVLVMDPRSGRRVAEIPAGAGARAPVLAHDGETLYVLNQFEDSVSVIDVAGRRVTATIPVTRQPYAAALGPGGKRLYVAGLLPPQAATAPRVAAEVCVIDTRANQLERRIALPNGSTGVRGIAISPDGRYAFVTHILARYTVHTYQLEQGWVNTNALSILDTAAGKLYATVLLDDVDNGAANPWAVAVSPDGRRLFVTHAGTDELSIIDLPALLRAVNGFSADPSDRLSFLAGFRQRVPLGGHGPRCLAIAGGKIWVGEYFSETVSGVSLGRRPELTTWRLGPERPLTPERRGEILFHDARVGFQHWQSCASCHPEGRVDGLDWDLLNDGIGNPKNTRSLVNSYRTPPAMWTGVRPDMNAAVHAGFEHILLRQPSEDMVRAVGAYLRSLQPVKRPVHDPGAVRRGRELFFSRRVGCAACHPPPLYTDNRLHEVGTHGKFDFVNGPGGRRTPQTAFVTPSLVEIWRTAPYLHDGRYATLREVITVGNHAGRRGRTSHLSEQQIGDLVAFLLSL